MYNYLPKEDLHQNLVRAMHHYFPQHTQCFQKLDRKSKVETSSKVLYSLPGLSTLKTMTALLLSLVSSC